MDSPFYFCCVGKKPVPDAERRVQCEGFGGPCSNTDASRVRMRTQYNDDDMNWAVLCPICKKEADESWNERWNEYYSGLL